MKRIPIIAAVVILLFAQSVLAEENKSFFGSVGDWISGAASDVKDWTIEAASDVANWTTNAATDAWNWTTGAANSAWNWVSGTATDTWNGVTGFFNPPESTGNKGNIAPEPELPEGTNKLYLGYEARKTKLDSGFLGTEEIDPEDPHYGLKLGKFYVSGFTSVVSENGKDFVFLKTVGDNVELHFELVQDIDMLGGDTLVTINSVKRGRDRYFETPEMEFKRGTLIVRHKNYQNDKGEAQIYTDYLAGKMSGSADTVISLNEEGDYEVALDYEIKKETRVLGTKATTSQKTDYQVLFTFSVRNGNCMVFPFDAVTRGELKNTAVTENGFYLDLAQSRYLDINVKRSVLIQQANGAYTEDVRFNRPASDGTMYNQEGIYTITAHNRYTDEQTVKTIYVGTDPNYIEFVSQGMNVEQILRAMQK